MYHQNNLVAVVQWLEFYVVAVETWTRIPAVTNFYFYSSCSAVKSITAHNVDRIIMNAHDRPPTLSQTHKIHLAVPYPQHQHFSRPNPLSLLILLPPKSHCFHCLIPIFSLTSLFSLSLSSLSHFIHTFSEGTMKDLNFDADKGTRLPHPSFYLRCIIPSLIFGFLFPPNLSTAIAKDFISNFADANGDAKYMDILVSLPLFFPFILTNSKPQISFCFLLLEYKKENSTCILFLFSCLIIYNPYPFLHFSKRSRIVKLKLYRSISRTYLTYDSSYFPLNLFQFF